MPNEHNDTRRHHIPKMRFQVTNWTAYEAGLRRRGLSPAEAEARYYAQIEDVAMAA